MGPREQQLAYLGKLSDELASHGFSTELARIELLTDRRPYRLTLSLYGASEESYDGMVKRKGPSSGSCAGLTPRTRPG